MLQRRKPRVWIQSHGRQLFWPGKRAIALAEPQVHQHLAQRPRGRTHRREVVIVLHVLLDQIAQALHLGRQLLVRRGHRQEVVQV